MEDFEIIENREKNIKAEVWSGIVALTVSLIFVSTNHIGHFYQIYYVIVVFIIHQINQLLIHNKWDIRYAPNAKKYKMRILIIVLFIALAFLDLGYRPDYLNGFSNPKKYNTFLSVVFYCVVYLLYLVGMDRYARYKSNKN